MTPAVDILGARVLIVDDQPANVLLLERMLRGAGYRAVQGTTDPRAVRALHVEHRFDLVLLDLQMPGMDGFEVMAALKEVETGDYLSVLVVTAQPDHKIRALRAGAKDFVSKPFEIAEVLMRVRNLLEVKLLLVETKRLYQEVLSAQRMSERLLLNVLPRTIAHRLQARAPAEEFTEVIVDSFADATVMFADIVDFTGLSARLTPESLVDLLNDLFTRFDRLADLHGLEKIKTIGDAYMAVAGLPTPVVNHADRAAHMALEVLQAVQAFNEHTGHSVQVRIGLSSGPGVAGVIGRRKFSYDLWGEVVNNASRMESQGVPGRVQITEATQRRLDNGFLTQPRGPIQVRGRAGLTPTWFLEGWSPHPAK